MSEARRNIEYIARNAEAPDVLAVVGRWFMGRLSVANNARWAVDRVAQLSLFEEADG